MQFIASTSFRRLGTVQGWLSLAIICGIIGAVVLGVQQEPYRAAGGFLSSLVSAFLLYCVDPKSEEITVLRIGQVLAIIGLVLMVVFVLVQLWLLVVAFQLIVAMGSFGAMTVMATLIAILAVWIEWATYGGALMQIDAKIKNLHRYPPAPSPGLPLPPAPRPW